MIFLVLKHWFSAVLEKFCLAKAIFETKIQKWNFELLNFEIAIVKSILELLGLICVNILYCDSRKRIHKEKGSHGEMIFGWQPTFGAECVGTPEKK